MAYSTVAGSSVFALAASSPDSRAFIASLIAGLTSFILIKRQPGPEKRVLDGVKSEWGALAGSWNVPNDDITALRHGLDGKKKQYDGLPNHRAMLLTQLSQQVRERQLKDYLSRFPIAMAKIRGVSFAKIATLSSYGIDAADDVEHDKIVQVPGFGETLATRLIAWRQSKEQNFRFDASRGVPQSDLASVERGIAMTRATIERDISLGLARLKALVASASVRRESLIRRSEQLMPQYEQAAANARVIPGNVKSHKRLIGLACVIAVVTLVMSFVHDQPHAGLVVPQSPPVAPQSPSRAKQIYGKLLSH